MTHTPNHHLAGAPPADAAASDREASPGIQVNAGDSVYIPAGALQMQINDDGTLDFVGVTVAVDPWLPNMSAQEETSLAVVESILANGFPVSTICQGSVFACQKSQDVKALVADPKIQRLKHMAVIDGQQAVGVLDLDVARGRFQHGESGPTLLVESVYESASKSNSMRGDAPLMDYLLTADQQSFRLVEIDGGKLATLDVEDLQKTPVRGVLLMWFSYLESLLARRLCQERPKLQEIVRSDPGVESDSFGGIGPGPERTIERYKFQDILKQAKMIDIIVISNDEIEFLNRYRNKIFHSPRWYVTRRSEVSSLVNCVKKVVYLTRELAES